jgi:hypothetical protein
MQRWADFIGGKGRNWDGGEHRREEALAATTPHAP